MTIIQDYLKLTQEQRILLPSNAKMIAGFCVNNILQKFYAIQFGTLDHKESCSQIKIF